MKNYILRIVTSLCLTSSVLFGAVNGHEMVSNSENSYSISKNVVTNGQFVNFLNSIKNDIKDATVENETFKGITISGMNPMMDGSVNLGNIIPIFDLVNSDGIELIDGSYSVKGDASEELRGASAVGAALYCNWLTNGGAENSSYLTGAYNFTNGGDIIDVFVNVDTDGYRLPTSDEMTEALDSNLINIDQTQYQYLYSYEILGDLDTEANSLKTLSPAIYNFDSANCWADNEVWGCDFVTEFRVVTTAVPEPSTYAAIFGALAFVFAVYRRRK